MQVKVTGYEKRLNSEGKEFFVLILEGDSEMVRSKTTNKFYMTSRKTSITTTFDEETCKGMVGTRLPGKITTVECEPYQRTDAVTGEIKTITSRSQYEHVEAPVEHEVIDIESIY